MCCFEYEYAYLLPHVPLGKENYVALLRDENKSRWDNLWERNSASTFASISLLNLTISSDTIQALCGLLEPDKSYCNDE